MKYTFRYRMDGNYCEDEMCCAPEEFSEIEMDIVRSGGEGFEVLGMEVDDYD